MRRTSSFDLAYNATMGAEGGYQHDPDDDGNTGELGTYKGIAFRFWPSWKGWEIIRSAIRIMGEQPPYGTKKYRQWAQELNDTLALNRHLQILVEGFYRENFWNPYRLDEIENQNIADWAFDHIVNGGPRGVRWIREAAGLHPDGDIDDNILLAINGTDPKTLLERARLIALNHRLARIERHPEERKYLHSWLVRDGFTESEISEIKTENGWA